MFLHQQTEQGTLGDARTMSLHTPTYQLSAEGIRVPVTVRRYPSYIGHMSEVWSGADVQSHHWPSSKLCCSSNAWILTRG